MLINPSIIVLKELLLFYLQLIRVPVFDDFYLSLILLLCSFFYTVAEIDL